MTWNRSLSTYHVRVLRVYKHHPLHNHWVTRHTYLPEQISTTVADDNVLDKTAVPLEILATTRVANTVRDRLGFGDATRLHTRPLDRRDIPTTVRPMTLNE